MFGLGHNSVDSLEDELYLLVVFIIDVSVLFDLVNLHECLLLCHLLVLLRLSSVFLEHNLFKFLWILHYLGEKLEVYFEQAYSYLFTL